MVAGGERAGKSRSLAEDLLSEAVDEAKRKRALVLIWLIAKEYEGTRKEFAYIVESMQKLGVLNSLSFPDRGPCTALARWDGSAVRVKTRCGKDAKKVAETIVKLWEMSKKPDGRNSQIYKDLKDKLTNWVEEKETKSKKEK